MPKQTIKEKIRQPIKFFATFLTTLYAIFLYKVVSGQVSMSGPMINMLPQSLQELDGLVYLAGVPIFLLWVLVSRVTHLNDDEKVIRAIKQEREALKRHS